MGDTTRNGLHRICERSASLDVPEGELGRNDLIDAARCYLAAAVYARAPQLTQPMPAWARDNAAPWPFPEEEWAPSADVIANLATAGAYLAAAIDHEAGA